jgi:hypothetical protein
VLVRGRLPGRVEQKASPLSAVRPDDHKRNGWELPAPALELLPEGKGMMHPTERPQEAPEWLWCGEVDGKPGVSFARSRHVFEIIIAALNHDGRDINSLTVGEIRRALL